MKTPKILNLEELPNEPHILLPSRLNGDELTFLIIALSDRNLTILVEEGNEIHEDLKEAVKANSLDGVSFSAEDSYLSDVGRSLESRLGEKGVALFLPPRANTSNGNPLDVPHQTLKGLCELELPLATLSVHRPEEHRLRVDDLSDEPPVIMSIGKAMRSDTLSVSNIIQEMLIGSEKAFSSRDFLKGSLPAFLLKSLHKNGKNSRVFDGNDDSELTYHKILAASLALSDYILSHTTKRRVGIILPPGKGGLITNLAVLFSGKVPVNLNFTSSKAAIKSSIKQADIDLFITAQLVMEKIPSFPWPEREELVLLDALTPKLKPAVLKWVLKLKISSPEGIIKKRGLEKRNDGDEAILLFTSGSSGLPKGVPLSHRNVLANICQFGTRLNYSNGTKILGCLPLFHSFGSTVCMFFPLMECLDLVTYPNPLDVKRIGELISKHEVTLLTATPTFLRGYLRRIEPEQLKSLKYVITGAEKLPQDVANHFEKRFGIKPLEGYGLTETSPASHLSIPSNEEKEGMVTLKTEKQGTVGMPLVGMAMRLVDPMTGVDVPLSSSGCLLLKGANIFNGYLDMPEVNDKIFYDGWFNTGDIGRVDDEGFLKIEGRLSRFSKIAGEMVSHESVEDAISKVLNTDDQEERKFAIVGMPCEKKGEKLILLSSIPEDDADVFINDLKKKLIQAEIPSLWCPKKMLPTSKIPMLGSGKLDIAQCRKIVEGAMN